VTTKLLGMWRRQEQQLQERDLSESNREEQEYRGRGKTKITWEEKRRESRKLNKKIEKSCSGEIIESGDKRRLERFTSTELWKTVLVPDNGGVDRANED
jgi:hypothetical protein